MAVSYSTASTDGASQLDYWRDVVCATFVQLELEPPARCHGRFRGRVVAQDLDCVQVATVTADPHAVVRTPAAIRRSGEDDFFVDLAVQGRLAMTQDGREALLRPGDFTVYDSSRPCRISGLGPFELIVVKVSRQAFLAHCPLPKDATATVVRGDRGTGALLAPFLRALATHAASLPPAAVPLVGGNVLELLGTALTERAGATSRSAAPRPGQLQRARRYILNHLAEPGLSPATVAAALGVSVRYLQGIFHAEGTSPFRWVQEQRLEQAAGLLSDPGCDGLTITDVAFRVGFTDTSHFSRSFKRRYGTGPRDYRGHRRG
ncbi:MAG: helix-turn-helix domain-containing protein [Actinobacteria bacterium]|nr:helix-turn-helix domain-containing protein [Actinomycetota bacterium]